MPGANDRSKEKWFPSSVDFMLAKYDHVRLPICFRDKLIKGGHLGWRAYDSRKLPLIFSFPKLIRRIHPCLTLKIWVTSLEPDGN